jgi:uncharacterized protein YecT (DUF1311 family)
MLQAALSIVVWCAFASLVAAAPQGDPCRTKANQLELTQCADRELAKSEATLSQAYKSLFADLDDEHRPLLEKAQRAWIAFRDADCELDASHALGGSMFPVLVSECRRAMADTRVKDIKALRKTLADFLR